MHLRILLFARKLITAVVSPSRHAKMLRTVYLRVYQPKGSPDTFPEKPSVRNAEVHISRVTLNEVKSLY